MWSRRSGAVCALLLCGCGVEARGPTASSPGAVVYGDDDRMEYYAHPDAVLRARALESTVALVRPSRIDTSDPSRYVIDNQTLRADENLCIGEPFAEQQVGAFCSSTLVGWDLVMTAGHCIDDLADCQDTWFVFDDLYEAPGVLAVIEPQDVFQCQRVVARRNQGGIDYAFVQLDRPVSPPRRPAPVDLADLPRVVGSSVAVVGFPDGIPVKLDSGGVVLWDGAPDYEEFEATTDTFGGNSGSGVYDANRNVIGILTRGETDYVREGRCFVVNRLPSTGAQGDAEGIAYVGRALEGLCASGWRGELCGDAAGTCQACVGDEVCPDGHVCRAAPSDPAATWCAAPCTTDAECPADHSCVAGGCDPALGTICVGASVHRVDVCGHQLEALETCLGPAEVCEGGRCRAADPGNSCSDAVQILAVDQVITASVGVGLTNEAEGSCGGAGPERVYAFELDARTRLVATSEGFDTVLHLRASCNLPSTELACSDDADPPGRRGSQITATLEPGPYALFMDSYGEGGGDYTLTLAFTDLSPPDAGVEPDTGVEVDAGAAPDADIAPDAGVAPSADAGAIPVDAGSGLETGDDGGCGCTTERSAPSVSGLLLCVGLLWGRRRRGR